MHYSFNMNCSGKFKIEYIPLMYFLYILTCNTIVINYFQSTTVTTVVSLYKESCNNKPMYGYMLPNLSPSPNLYKVQECLQ